MLLATRIYIKVTTQENSWVWADRIRLQEGKLIPKNFPAGPFLRKADKCFGVCLKVGTNENGLACGRWLSIGIVVIDVLFYFNLAAILE